MNKTTAEQIAEQFHNDGQRWNTDDGIPLSHICEAEYPTTDRRADSTRYTFADGSVILATDGGWDLGYAGCWCWEGEGHTEACEARKNDRAHIMVMIHNSDGRPCAWGLACTQEAARDEAECQWAAHSCYDGEQRGKVTANDLDLCIGPEEV